MEAALASLEDKCRSVTLTGVTDCAGVHDSALRRYFSSHKGGAQRLAAEGWTRWSNTVCAAFREPGPMSPSQVAETLANGLADDPPICDLLATFTCTSSTRGISIGLSRSGGPAPLPKFSLADAIEQALPVLGTRAHYTSFLRATH